jgi:hypothetical protein
VEERERSGRLSPEIFVYATNKNFLNVYDALRIDKIKVEIAGYDPATNRQTGHATGWLDTSEMRLLAHLVTQRQFASVTGGRWEKFGGSQRDDGLIESRTITVEWDEGDGGRFARMPYRLTIANGPGRRTQTGAVQPAGEPTARLSMRLAEMDLMRVMLAVDAYIRAHETVYHRQIVEARVQELSTKLLGRAPGGAPSRDASAPDRPPRVAAQGSRTEQPGRPPLRAVEGGANERRIDRLDSQRTARAG